MSPPDPQLGSEAKAFLERSLKQMAGHHTNDGKGKSKTYPKRVYASFKFIYLDCLKIEDKKL